jgi:uncharacterized membrane protein YsdA (DUF1294 family)
MQPRHRRNAPNRSPGRVSLFAWIELAVLVALPIGALARFSQTIDWPLLFGVPVVASAASIVAYWTDKVRAQAGEWRITEGTLHLLEAFGGWPGAFIAQRAIHHKTKKAWYQFAFWTIVAIHEFWRSTHFQTGITSG